MLKLYFLKNFSITRLVETAILDGLYSISKISARRLYVSSLCRLLPSLLIALKVL